MSIQGRLKMPLLIMGEGVEMQSTDFVQDCMQIHGGLKKYHFAVVEMASTWL